MKRLLDRLRRWLIVKLGGYTVQHISHYRRIENYRKRDALPVRVEVKAYPEWLQRDRFGVWEEVKQELAYRLATELLRHDAILFTTRQEETERCVIVRADIEVVKGNTLAWDGIATVGSLNGREMETGRWRG